MVILAVVFLTWHQCLDSYDRYNCRRPPLLPLA